MALAQGASPQDVATHLYGAIESDDYEAFKEAVKKFYRDQLNKKIRGVSPEFWWNSGRRYATEYGVTWHFVRVDKLDEKRAKLFYQRKHQDGSDRGMPVPIHLIVDEDGEWRVDVATV